MHENNYETCTNVYARMQRDEKTCKYKIQKSKINKNITFLCYKLFSKLNFEIDRQANFPCPNLEWMD